MDRARLRLCVCGSLYASRRRADIFFSEGVLRAVPYIYISPYRWVMGFLCRRTSTRLPASNWDDFGAFNGAFPFTRVCVCVRWKGYVGTSVYTVSG